MDYYSSIDINNIQPIYKNDYHKAKFLRVMLNTDQVLIIPPYWFYSIKFLEENTIAFFNSYRTFTSSIAIIPDLFIQMLQQNNLKLNMIKKTDINNENIISKSVINENETETESLNNETETLNNENLISKNEIFR